MAEQAEEFDPLEEIVTLISMDDSSGNPAWALMKMNMIQYTAYQFKLEEEGSFSGNLNDYGEILESGWGEFPTESDMEKLLLEHGDAEVSEKLKELLDKENA